MVAVQTFTNVCLLRVCRKAWLAGEERKRLCLLRFFCARNRRLEGGAGHGARLSLPLVCLYFFLHAVNYHIALYLSLST